jgi:hypothetical protein
MVEKYKPNPKFTTPKGVFKFPRLNEPDTKFNKNGEYSVKLIVPMAEAKALADKLAPAFDAAKLEGETRFKELPVASRKKLGELTVNPLFTEVFDEETEEPTGEVTFNFKMTASGVSKKTNKPWSRKPAIFDATGKPMVNAPSIWGGTVGKVSFEVVPYWNAAAGACGLSLRLQAVQVIDLVSGGGRSAGEYGFGEEEGYAHDPSGEGFSDESSAPASTSTDGEEDF